MQNPNVWYQEIKWATLKHIRQLVYKMNEQRVHPLPAIADNM